MFVCDCGHTIRTNVDPVQAFGQLIRNVEADDYRDAARGRIVDDAEQTAADGLGMREVPAGGLTSFSNRVNDALHEEFLERARHVVDCPACENLYVSSGPGSRDYVRYRKVPSDLREAKDSRPATV